MQKRTTNQQLIILDFLRKDKTHPTAEEVYLAVQKKLPQISKATVYRILDNFSRDGVIRKIKIEKHTSSPTRFDGNQKNHHHFICQKCEKIFDIYDNKISNYFKKIKPNFQEGTIKTTEIFFKGVCTECSD